MKRILLTNDDGLHSVGLRVARRVLAEFGEVTTVVPDREMSGASHALTLNHPLRIDAVDESGVYIVNGTPTDCVNLALNQLLEAPPDLVFSGINPGSNVGLDVSYSGTVAGALEGALQGVAAVAVSLQSGGVMTSDAIAGVVRRVTEVVVERARPRLLLNVNIPAGPVQGMRLAVQGKAGFRSEIIEKRDPRGKSYYWIGGQQAHETEDRDHSDIATLEAGYVAITPLRLDYTDTEVYHELRDSWPTD